MCIFFSQKNAALETKPEKDARKPWRGSDHGLLRNGRGGREMCLQLGLPRAGPITSVRGQAEEISRANLSCGPKWIKGNLGWSHYKEINGASHLPLSCYPPSAHSDLLNEEEQNHHPFKALSCYSSSRFHAFFSNRQKERNKMRSCEVGSMLVAIYRRTRGCYRDPSETLKQPEAHPCTSASGHSVHALPSGLTGIHHPHP